MTNTCTMFGSGYLDEHRFGYMIGVQCIYGDMGNTSSLTFDEVCWRVGPLHDKKTRAVQEEAHNAFFTWAKGSTVEVQLQAHLALQDGVWCHQKVRDEVLQTPVTVGTKRSACRLETCPVHAEGPHKRRKHHPSADAATTPAPALALTVKPPRRLPRALTTRGHLAMARARAHQAEEVGLRLSERVNTVLEPAVGPRQPVKTPVFDEGRPLPPAIAAHALATSPMPMLGVELQPVVDTVMTDAPPQSASAVVAQSSSGAALPGLSLGSGSALAPPPPAPNVAMPNAPSPNSSNSTAAAASTAASGASVPSGAGSSSAVSAPGPSSGSLSAPSSVPVASSVSAPPPQQQPQPASSGPVAAPAGANQAVPFTGAINFPAAAAAGSSSAPSVPAPSSGPLSAPSSGSLSAPAPSTVAAPPQQQQPQPAQPAASSSGPVAAPAGANQAISFGGITYGGSALPGLSSLSAPAASSAASGPALSAPSLPSGGSSSAPSAGSSSAPSAPQQQQPTAPPASGQPRGPVPRPSGASAPTGFTVSSLLGESEGE